MVESDEQEDELVGKSLMAPELYSSLSKIVRY
jgi:hypothetical protein